MNDAGIAFLFFTADLIYLSLNMKSRSTYSRKCEFIIWNDGVQKWIKISLKTDLFAERSELQNKGQVFNEPAVCRISISNPAELDITIM